MRVVDLWKSDQKPTISFELFPPRSEKAADKLEKTIDQLAALNPDFVSVTFGAGGSMLEGSRRLVEKLMVGKGLDVLAYFACFGLSPEDIASILDSYQDLGVESILAVRGDAPREEGFKLHPDSLPHASDLVAFIRQRYPFCIGVAAYPEGHIDAVDEKTDLEYLKLKVNQGAEYIITNYFYDTGYFFDFIERCRGMDIRVPIIPGIMPIYSVKMMEMLAGICGATITPAVRKGLAPIKEDDKDALVAFGIEFAYRQCVELLKAGVPGLHIYTMDRSVSTVGLVNRLREEGLL